MKYLLLLLLPGMFIAGKSPREKNAVLQDPEGKTRISAVEFKNQQYCRAELKDFEFDAPFSVVGATVYFAGAGFVNPQKRFITSNSLKPLSDLMLRCTAGTTVVFDNVKVVGPDKLVRVIEGKTYVLY